MPTTLYGPNDNFDLYTSHVLPALIRKFHLGKCLAHDDFEALKRDLNFCPIEGIDGNAKVDEIVAILKKYGITREAITLWGTGQVYREFLFVDDLAEACVFLMEKVDAEEMNKLCPDYFVNVGTGQDLTIAELAEMVRDIVGFNGSIHYDTSKPDGTPRKLLDVSKIRQLGWEPKVSLQEGIEKTYWWYKKGVYS